MSRIFVSIVLVASVLASAAPPAAAASTLVCESGCAFTSIQAAINAAAAGDTIVVRPGTYSGALTIPTSLTLCSTTSSGTTCSPNPNEVTIDGAGNIYPIFITANNVVVRGFTIQNPTFLTVDQTAGRVDPSLVVIYGVDNVQILQNILQLPASPLAPTQSRWITDGVNVAEDAVGSKSDNARISGNIFREFVEGVGPDGTCANLPCRMAAIDLWGAGASPIIRNNNMLLPPGRADSTTPQVVGIWGGATGASVRDNFIQPVGDLVAGFYGVKGTYQSSVFEDNGFYGSLHGLFVAGSDLTIRDNAFLYNNEGLRITARDSLIEGNLFNANHISLKIAGPNGLPEATDLVFRENEFGFDTTKVSIHSQVAGITFDLRENDWGVYDADQIALFLDDQSGTNTLDISCFIDEDGVTRVCPSASFTTNVGNTWPRVVTLTDTSTFSGSQMASRLWTLPGGATSTNQVVTLSLNPGSYSFQLDVEDGEGFTDTASQSLTLANTAPSFTLAAAYAANEGTLLTIPLGATDAESDVLTYTLLAGPAGASINGSSLEWKPGYSTAGSHSIAVRVSDGNLDVARTSSIVVSDVPVGAPIDAIANVNMLELASVTRSIRAVSPSGASIALSATGFPAGATFTDHGGGLGTFSYTAPSGSAGSSTVTVSALSEGLTTTQTFSVTVTRSVGLALDRVTTSHVTSSPGATVTLVGRVTNFGSGGDSFNFLATNTRGWPVPSPGPLSLAAGANGLVSVTFVVPLGADATWVTLKACSATTPTVCKDTKWRIELPMVLTLDAQDVYGPLDPIVGTVTARYLDNTPVVGATIKVVERHQQNIWLLTSSDDGPSAADGTFGYALTHPVAKVPGTHGLVIIAKRGEVTSSLLDKYEVAAV